jgi:hypothetical protein
VLGPQAEVDSLETMNNQKSNFKGIRHKRKKIVGVIYRKQ